MSAAWPTAPMGEIAPLVRRPVLPEADKLYQEIGIRSFGKGIFHKAPTTGLEIGSKRVFAVEPGDLLFNIVFAWEGATAVATESERGMIGSHRFLTCVTDRLKADARFLRYWFTHAEGRDKLLQASPGGAGRNRTLGVEKLSAIHVPLPPLAEQRRIVLRIEELVTKIEEAKGLRHESSQELNSLFGRRIAETFTRQLDKSWKPGTLGEYVIDDCYGTSEKTNDDPRGTPILRMGNIQDGRLLDHPLKYLQLASKEREKLILKPNDILINRTNSAELVGKCAVFELTGEYGFASYLIRLRLDQTRSVPRLVAAYINSPIGRAYMFGEKKQMTGQANVNATTLKKLPLPLPHPHVQAEIMAELDSLQITIDAANKLQAKTATELDAMLPAVLDKAFKGDL